MRRLKLPLGSFKVITFKLCFKLEGGGGVEAAEETEEERQEKMEEEGQKGEECGRRRRAGEPKTVGSKMRRVGGGCGGVVRSGRR